MIYCVKITPDTEAAILAQAQYISVDCDAPLNAARWLTRMHKAAETLEQMPERCSKAKEDKARSYEVRQLNVGGYLLLFTIVDETNTVWVIGFRHSRQLERPDELPEDIRG